MLSLGVLGMLPLALPLALPASLSLRVCHKGYFLNKHGHCEKSCEKHTLVCPANSSHKPHQHCYDKAVDDCQCDWGYKASHHWHKKGVLKCEKKHH